MRKFIFAGLLVLIAGITMGPQINTSGRCSTGQNCSVGGGVASSFTIDTDGSSGDSEFIVPDITFEANGDWISNAEADSQFTFEIDEDSTVVLAPGDTTDANTPLTVRSAGTGALLIDGGGASAITIGSADVTTLTLTNNGALTLGAAATTDSATINSAGAITLEATGAINIGDASATSVPIITDGGTVTIDGYVQSIYQAPIELTAGTLTVNRTHIATAAGDYDLPDSCDTATGNWVTLIAQDASELVSLTVLAAEDEIKVGNIDAAANEEIDSPSAATSDGASITVACLQANVWYATAQVGVWVDGGTAD